MTISQPSSNQGPRSAGALSVAGMLYRALVCWRERRRTASELSRLAATGDHLLKDIGLDPELARANRAAALEQVMRRR